MKRLLACDFDGTLFRTDRAVAAAYDRALREYGCGISYEKYIRNCDGKNYKKFLPEIIGTDDAKILEEIHRKKVAYYEEYYDLIIPNLQLIETVKAFPRISAVVTTAAKKSVEDILEKFGYKRLFDIIVAGEDVKVKKPDPECYIKAMNIAGVKPCETVIYEDSETGLRAGRASGASVIKTTFVGVTS